MVEVCHITDTKRHARVYSCEPTCSRAHRTHPNRAMVRMAHPSTADKNFFSTQKPAFFWADPTSHQKSTSALLIRGVAARTSSPRVGPDAAAGAGAASLPFHDAGRKTFETELTVPRVTQVQVLRVLLACFFFKPLRAFQLGQRYATTRDGARRGGHPAHRRGTRGDVFGAVGS